MKILLINPPRSPENNILRFAPGEALPFIHRKLIGPPLGLLTIAAAVKDFDVTVFDMKGEYDLVSEAPGMTAMVRELMEIHQPDVVGVTVITSEFDYSMEICREAKKWNPAVLTVAGGLHATLCPEDFAGHQVDVVIQGQSAHIFRALMIAREKGAAPAGVPGLLINTKDGLKKTSPCLTHWKPAGANYLMPDRNHLKRWIDTYKVGNSPFPSTYLFTSLGCPYKCTFCSIWTQFKGKYFQRGVESIITELQLMDDYPVVRFADANTVVDIDFINLLFDRIVEEGIQKTFIMDIRADVASQHPALIEKLARGGLKVVICGFESFRDSELKRYNKDSPAINNKEAIKVFEQNGIMVRGNYVIPNDYTLDDFRSLADYANMNKVVYAGYTVLTPMPGTVFYQQVRDQIVDFDYRKYNFFNSVMRTHLPHDEFHEQIGRLWLIKKGTDVI